MKILMLSDSILTPTGFANQSRELAKRLSKDPDFDIYHLAWNYLGQDIKNSILMDGEEINVKILSGSRAPYGQGILQAYLKKYQPDIFWTLLDSFMLFPWIFNHSFTPAKSIMYYPSDGEYFPNGCDNVLKKYEHSVAMSRFAQKQVGDLYGIKSDYIPHATHPEIFKPLPQAEKDKTRDKYGIPRNAFVFGDVARNQGRKQMGLEIMAFGEFMKNNPNANAYLLLHTDFQDIAGHSNLINLADRYKIKDRIIGTGMFAHQGFPLTEIVKIYNAMDARISTSTGEGFGVCSIESLACEVPNINTDYTTTPELYGYPWPEIKEGHFLFNQNKELQIGDCGIGVPIATEIPGTWDVYRGFVSVPKFAEAMQKLYDEPELLEKMGKKGREKVLKYYSWDGPSGVAQQWKEYLKKVLE